MTSMMGRMQLWLCPECDHQTNQYDGVEVWCTLTINHRNNRKRKMKPA